MAADRAAEVSRAQRVANQIERDIIRERTPTRTVLGTREELCSRYNVSPAMLQQSARILQERGFAYLRPGNRGGLVVQSQTADVVARALATFLEFSAVTFEDAAEMAEGIAGIAVEKGLRSMDLKTADRLREHMRELENYHDDLELAQHYMHLRLALTDCVANPLLSLVHRTLARFLTDVTRMELRSTAERTAHHAFQKRSLSELISAVIAGDALSAHNVFRQNLEYLRSNVASAHDGERHPVTREVRAFVHGTEEVHGRGRAIRAEFVVREILGEIRARGWPTGERLGGETELLQKHGVSRATMRHAVRMLEEYSAVRMQRGPRGGLIVTSPNASRVVQNAASYVRREGISREQVRDVFEMMALRALSLIYHQDGVGAASLTAALESVLDAPDRAFPGAMKNLFLDLSALSQNKIIEVSTRLAFEVDQDILCPPRGRTARKQKHDLAAFAVSLNARDFPRARRALIDCISQKGVV